MEIWLRFYEKEQKEKINSKYDRAIESLGRKMLILSMTFLRKNII